MHYFRDKWNTYSVAVTPINEQWLVKRVNATTEEFRGTEKALKEFLLRKVEDPYVPSARWLPIDEDSAEFFFGFVE